MYTKAGFLKEGSQPQSFVSQVSAILSVPDYTLIELHVIISIMNMVEFHLKEVSQPQSFVGQVSETLSVPDKVYARIAVL